MEIYFLLKFKIFILLHLYIKCQINQNISNNRELEGIFRIDSLYNHYSLVIQKDNIFLTETKIGDNQMFFITSIFSNSYFIIFREHNKRIGIDDDNNLYLYKIEDLKNIEKTYWNIIRYENNNNLFLTQNVFNQKYLEINLENNLIQCKNDIQYDILNKKDSKIIYTFSFLNYLKK